MAKLVLSDVTNILTAAPTINNNSTLIEQALENTLSRDGTSPNEMNSDLDMNNHRIYNLPAPVDNSEPVRKQDILDIYDNFDALEEAVAAAAASAAAAQEAEENTEVIATYVEGLLSGVTGNMLRSDIPNIAIPGNSFYVTGNTVYGDIGQGAQYIKGTAGGPRAIQDLSGQWWNLSLAGVKEVISGWFGPLVTDLQLAINFAFTEGIKSVFVSPGTYTLTTVPLYMQAGVQVRANPGTVTVTQANAANLTVLVDWTVNSAAGAKLLNITVDGNRTNNTINVTSDRFALYVGAIAAVTVQDCTIQNFTGHGFYATSGINHVIRRNVFTNLNMFGVYIVSTTTGIRNAPVIDGNTFLLCGWHSAVVVRSADAQIINNTAIATRVSGVVVTVSGTTVTWVSGPNFADVVPGNFIIYNGGIEALVTAKASNTSLTIHAATGDGVSVPAALGGADTIGSWSSVNTRIANNIVKGGASLAYSIFADQVNHVENEVGTLVENNLAEGIGSAGFSVQTSGTGVVNSASFRNNQAVECGLNTTASASGFNAAMGIVGGISNITVIGNQWISYGSAMLGLNVMSSTNGQVFTADNRGKLNTDTITGGATVSANSGWGAGATFTINRCSDDHVLLTIVSGVGPSAAASFTLTHKNLPVRRKQPNAQMIGTTGAMAHLLTFLPDTDTQSTIVFDGSPGGSTTYYILVRL